MTRSVVVTGANSVDAVAMALGVAVAPAVVTDNV